MEAHRVGMHGGLRVEQACMEDCGGLWRHIEWACMADFGGLWRRIELDLRGPGLGEPDFARSWGWSDPWES